MTSDMGFRLTSGRDLRGGARHLVLKTMEDIVVRSCREDELKYFLEVCEAAFGHEIRDEEVDNVRRILDADRTLGAFEGNALIGTAAACSFTLTVPGGYVPAAGVTMVGVLASHRRRGALTRMMRSQLEDVHRRGEPLAILWASEGNIYERFGYGLATLNAPINIERDRTAWRHPVPPEGRVRLLSFDEAVKELPDVYDRVCAATPGMFARSQEWWEAHRLYDPEHERDGGSQMYRALWEIDGQADAYALYRMFGKWDDTSPTGFLLVLEALGTDARATREIWRFLFGVDLMVHVRAYWQPVPHPLHLMLAEPRRLRSQISDGLWLRIVDLRDALESRSYAQEGTIAFEVIDSFCPWNEGRWLLTVSGSTAAVERTSGPADLAVTIQDIGSIYLGAFTFSQWAAARKVGELTEGAAWRADALFRTPTTAFCPEVF
jgi:predicted acetyltransferase